MAECHEPTAVDVGTSATTKTKRTATKRKSKQTPEPEETTVPAEDTNSTNVTNDDPPSTVAENSTIATTAPKKPRVRPTKRSKVRDDAEQAADAAADTLITTSNDDPSGSSAAKTTDDANDDAEKPPAAKPSKPRRSGALKAKKADKADKADEAASPAPTPTEGALRKKRRSHKATASATPASAPKGKGKGKAKGEGEGEGEEKTSGTRRRAAKSIPALRPLPESVAKWQDFLPWVNPLVAHFIGQPLTVKGEAMDAWNACRKADDGPGAEVIIDAMTYVAAAGKAALCARGTQRTPRSKVSNETLDMAATHDKYSKRLVAEVPADAWKQLDGKWLSNHGFDGLFTAADIEAGKCSSISGTHASCTVFRVASSMGVRPLGIVSAKTSRTDGAMRFVHEVPGDRVYIGQRIKGTPKSVFAMGQADQVKVKSTDALTSDATATAGASATHGLPPKKPTTEAPADSKTAAGTSAEAGDDSRSVSSSSSSETSSSESDDNASGQKK